MTIRWASSPRSSSHASRRGAVIPERAPLLTWREHWNDVRHPHVLDASMAIRASELRGRHDVDVPRGGRAVVAECDLDDARCRQILLHDRDDMRLCLVFAPVSYTHLRAHETDSYLVCRLLLEQKKD